MLERDRLINLNENEMDIIKLATSSDSFYFCKETYYVLLSPSVYKDLFNDRKR